MDYAVTAGRVQGRASEFTSSCSTLFNVCC
jgi:hypothetical protein